MTQTKEKLQQDYAVRFLAAAGCTAVCAITARLILLGSKITSDNFLWSVFIAAVFGVAAWKLLLILCVRWKDLKQREVLQQHGPYDRREFVAPKDATNQIGDDGNGTNMWRPK